jgi:hypothetical protein
MLLYLHPIQQLQTSAHDTRQAAAAKMAMPVPGRDYYCFEPAAEARPKERKATSGEKPQVEYNRPRFSASQQLPSYKGMVEHGAMWMGGVAA